MAIIRANLFEVEKDAATSLRFVLMSLGQVVTGIAHGSVTAYATDPSGNQAEILSGAGEWTEIGNGVYTLAVAGTVFDEVGEWVIILQVVGADDAVRTVLCVTKTAADRIEDAKTTLGTAIILDGGTASIAGMLTKLADDNGGADFNAGTDSQNKIAAGVQPACNAALVAYPVPLAVDVQSSCDAALTAAGTATAGNVTTSEGNVTAAISASQLVITNAISATEGNLTTEIQTLQNTIIINVDVPPYIIKPTAGSKSYRCVVSLFDGQGNPEAPDAAPDFRLDSLSGAPPISIMGVMFQDGVKVGVYYYDWTVTSVSDDYKAVIEITVVDGGVTHRVQRLVEYVEGVTTTALLAAINAVPDLVWDEASSGHTAAGSFGLAMKVIRAIARNGFEVEADGTYTVFEDDGTTPLITGVMKRSGVGTNIYPTHRTGVSGG